MGIPGGKNDFFLTKMTDKVCTYEGEQTLNNVQIAVLQHNSIAKTYSSDFVDT